MRCLVDPRRIACHLVGVRRAPAQPDASDPAALARAVQARYDRVRDFTADFTHTYTGGVLKKQVVERGTIQVKKPGRMRWRYTNPEEKLFVSDGRQIYSYVPADRQVIVSPMPAEDRATTAALFLTGKGDLARDFTAKPASVPAGAPPRLGGDRADPPPGAAGVQYPHPRGQSGDPRHQHVGGG